MPEATTTTVDQDLPEYPTPRSEENRFVPPPELLALHGTGTPIHRVRTWDGTTPWLAVGYDAQKALLSNDKLSADIAAPGYPVQTPSMKAHAKHMKPGLNNTDGAEHTRWRRMLTNAFTRKRMGLLRPQIQAYTDELIDAMLAGPRPAELNEALSLPLPSLMICALLGVPYSDHGFFQEHASMVTARYKTAEQSAETQRILSEYIGDLLDAKADDPGEDVLTDLAGKIREGVLARDEAQRLGLMVLVAGHDTSANMITLGTALLLRHPDQLAELRARSDDEKYVAGAVEELLRYLTIPHLLARRAVKEDFEIEGVTIRSGEGVITSLQAANFDPTAFPDPTRVDLTRPAAHHLAFGWGPHQCVGQQLARIELQVVFSTLFRKVPTLALAVEESALRYKDDSQAYGIYELPVTW